MLSQVYGFSLIRAFSRYVGSCWRFWALCWLILSLLGPILSPSCSKLATRWLNIAQHSPTEPWEPNFWFPKTSGYSKNNQLGGPSPAPWPSAPIPSPPSGLLKTAIFQVFELLAASGSFWERLESILNAQKPIPG